jgi:hypothetical protein
MGIYPIKRGETPHPEVKVHISETVAVSTMPNMFARFVTLEPAQTGVAIIENVQIREDKITVTSVSAFVDGRFQTILLRQLNPDGIDAAGTAMDKVVLEIDHLVNPHVDIDASAATVAGPTFK